MKSLCDQFTDAVSVELEVSEDVTDMEQAGKSTIPTDARLGLYRVVEESLGNVVKHAEASRVTVSLWIRKGTRMLYLSVEDNGKGFEQSTEESSPSLGLTLLSDLRDVFGKADKIATESILTALHDKDDAPWGDLRGKPLTNTNLSRLLKPYGIKPKVLNLSGKSHRGYSREDFYDAWKRYLRAPGENPVTPVTDETTSEK